MIKRHASLLIIAAISSALLAFGPAANAQTAVGKKVAARLAAAGMAASCRTPAAERPAREILGTKWA